MDDLITREGLGTILFFSELRMRLAMISHGPHQWTASLVNEGDDDEQDAYVDIHYTNPEPVDVPNALCLRFPTVGDMNWPLCDALVCLHPSLATPMAHGLYLEGDQLLEDELEDFYRLWRPLRRLL